MAEIELENIKMSYGGAPVLESVSISLNKGEKTGLVGQNGCGKTTLLEIAAGKLEPDAGTVRFRGKPTIGILSQKTDIRGSETVFQAAGKGLKEINALEQEKARLSAEIERSAAGSSELDRLVKRHTALEEKYRLVGGYSKHGKVGAVLKGLGFGKEDLSKPVDALSGGEAKRLQLACVLLGKYDVLFLDEPGNHLDISGTEWLTGFMKSYKGTVLIISHDRYLLNGAADKIAELEGGRIHIFSGNYDFFIAERKRRREALAKKRMAREKEIADKEEYIRRNIYGQKAGQARSRRKMLERIEVVDAPLTVAQPRFRFMEASTSGDHVVHFERVSLSLGNRVLYEKIDLELEMGETLGIVGPNGSGKTSLLKLVLGQISCSSGMVRLPPSAKPVYFDQQLESIAGTNTLLYEMQRLFPLSTPEELRNHLARFLFSGKEVESDLHNLSGGERSRALLAKISFAESNLLLLDEPTNHLDIYARESLEGALKRYKGAVIIVSHDRCLLDGVADKLLILGDTMPYLHHGNYSSYIGRRSRESRDAHGKKRTERPARASRMKRHNQVDSVKRRHTYEELEALIIANEERIEEIGAEIYKEEVYMDRSLSDKLEKEAVKLRKELNDLYKEWDTWA